MDHWFGDFQNLHSVAYSVFLLAAVATVGLSLGSLRVRGVGLGVSGVLFAGLFFGHFGFQLEASLLEFLREFGLILFVYTIGMQVGPGFFTSLRKQGLPLNLMAVSIVLIGAALALAFGSLAGLDIALTAGIFSGATTNTPALGAAQEALKSVANGGIDRQVLPGLGYAVAYPFGIVGIIAAMLALRAMFRVDVEQESESFRKEQKAGQPPLERMNLRVENENLEGLTIAHLPGIRELGVVVSRIRPRNQTVVSPAHEDTVLHCGDLLLAVGPRAHLEEFRLIVGDKVPEDLMKAPGRVTWKRVVVTAKPVLGKSLRESALDHLYAVTVTRVSRGDVELVATSDLRLQFGDVLQVVGEPDALARVTKVLGNSARELSQTNLVPVFVGIALGIILGTYPFHLHGVPAPIKLGLAGGPLLVAIFLSRLGNVGSLIWYMPQSANIVLRELGIVLFLACVGLKAGGHFMETLLHGDGLLFMAMGAAVTLVPLLSVGIFARLFLRLNFMSLCGLLSGSMTDPPALAFANTIGRSDAPSVAYATVYPLTMLLRIVVAQMIVLIFSR